MAMIDFPMGNENNLLEEIKKYLSAQPVNQVVSPTVVNQAANLIPKNNTAIVPRSLSPSGMSYLQRALALTEQQPDTAALQEYAKARQAQGQQSMLNALAAGIAGPQYQGLQQGYLRRAMAAQEPEQVGPGMAYGGKYIADPYAGRKEQVAALSNIGKEAIDLEKEKLKSLEQKYQQGGTFALPDGTIVSGMFDPKLGYVYETPNGLAKLPQGSRPATPGMAGPLAASQFNKLTNDLNNEQNSLGKINKYLSTVENTDVGLTRLANDISANVKTAFGSKKLSSDELNQQIAKGQLQGLIGMLRTDVVGPGVMTEQDALRVIQAVGGDFNLLQNPETVKALLKDIIEQKQSRINLLNRQVHFSEKYYPGVSGSTFEASPQDSAPAKNRVVVDY